MPGSCPVCLLDCQVLSVCDPLEFVPVCLVNLVYSSVIQKPVNEYMQYFLQTLENLVKNSTMPTFSNAHPQK